VSPEHLHHLMETARKLLHEYGYAGLFGLIFLENFGFPVPGETLFIAAILAAAHGEMRIVPVVLCAWAASVLGGIVGFAIGRFGGHKLLQKYGPYVGINAERLHKVEDFSKKYGALFVILGRFFEGVRQIYAILAGCIASSWQRFLINNVIGATLWVGWWTFLVLWFHHNARHIWAAFKEHEVYVFLGVALVAGLSALLLHLHRRLAPSTGTPSPPASDAN
jgi:membrane protein DedA with SNARE-associated domain